MGRTRRDWLRRCPSCRFLASTLPVHLNGRRAAIDEGARAIALRPLRRRNFERVLDVMAQSGLESGGRILDVGCGHGWFVQAAASRTYRAIGIEPDDIVAAAAGRDGACVRHGSFPQALEANERFDAIVFNDVLEHLRDPAAALRAARSHLMPGGLVVINLPLASGALYRVSDVLDRCGIHGPFERMWQKSFPSPHVSYFTQPQLARVAAACGLLERWRGALASVDASGLLARLRYDRTATPRAALVMWMALRPLLPILTALPLDIGLQVFVAAAAERGTTR